MRKQLLITTAPLPDVSLGGIIATAMRFLASAAPSATGATLIAPDGTARYISREEAENFIRNPKAGEVMQ